MSWGVYHVEANKYHNGVIRVTNYDDILYFLKTDYEINEFKKILTENQKIGIETGYTVYLNRSQYNSWLY